MTDDDQIKEIVAVQKINIHWLNKGERFNAGSITIMIGHIDKLLKMVKDLKKENAELLKPSVVIGEKHRGT